MAAGSDLPRWQCSTRAWSGQAAGGLGRRGVLRGDGRQGRGRLDAGHHGIDRVQALAVVQRLLLNHSLKTKIKIK